MRYLVNEDQLLTEVIFKNRHQQYGAYVLRSSYHRTMLRIIVTVVVAALLLAFSVSRRVPQARTSDDHGQIADTAMWKVIHFKPLTDEDKVKPEPEKARHGRPSPQPSGKPQTTYTISDNPGSEDTTAVTQGSMQEDSTMFNAETTSGIGSPGLNPARGTDSVPVNGIFADAAAEFPGNIRTAIARMLQYPREAAEEGIEGIVLVRFVVSVKGQVTGLRILRSVHPKLDAEAVRVIRALPDFTRPATKNGAPVNSYYDVPIKFSLR